MSEANQDRDLILGHADEADGIEEYDNRLPAWWLGLFYACIAWAGLYGVHYHFVADRSQVGAYDAEVALADVRWPTPAAPTEVAQTDDAILAGKGIYESTCIGCHGPELQGLIGPSLMDDTWIRGAGTPADVAEIVTNGSPAKGMPAWAPVLGTEKVSQVVAFLLKKREGA